MPKEHGYLFIDHTASPGLPEDIARLAGFDPNLVKEGKRMESSTLCCAHCKNHVVPNPLRVLERAQCARCSHYICDVCAFEASLPDYSHAPYEKKVDLILSGKETQLGSPRKLITST